MTITAGEQELQADVVISGVETGRQHYIRVEGRELWRVPGRAVIPETSKPPKPIDYHEGVRCAQCKRRKPRKGGTNAGHRFICADCRPGD